MVIQHNIAAINSYRNLGINQSGLSKNLEKLSSGYRVNRAGDDNQAVTNAKDAIGLIQTAEGALTETHSMLQRLVTLATQSANGTYSSTARANIQEEAAALEKEITRIADNTDFNGIKPLKKTQASGMTFQIGPSSAETINVNMSHMDAASLLTSATKISSEITDQTKAKDNLLKTINNAITSVSKYRAHLGAAQNRLEHTVNNLKVTSENIQAAESRIRDTDMAEEITAYTKNNILLQAAQSMLTQANASPQGVLSMLG